MITDLLLNMGNILLLSISYWERMIATNYCAIGWIADNQEKLRARRFDKWRHPRFGPVDRTVKVIEMENTADQMQIDLWPKPECLLRHCRSCDDIRIRLY